jgi:hypothetical protein
LMFPAVKSMVAVRTPIVGFWFTEAFFQLEEGMTDFTSNLLAAFAIVEIQIFRGSMTAGALG